MNLINRIKILEEKIGIKESFKSQQVKLFFDNLENSNIVRLNWSTLSDDDVKYLTPEKALSYVNDNYIIMWGSKSKKVLKHKDTTYTKFGYKRDNNIYVNPGLICITHGKRFIRLNNGEISYLEDSFNKPYSGNLSFLKLKNEIADYVLVLDINAAKESSKSRSELRNIRSISKQDAVALIKNADIARNNIYRYKELLKKQRTEKETNPIKTEIIEVLEKLKIQINSLSGLNLISPRKGYRDNEELNIDSKSFEKIQNLVKRFNRISSLFAEYLHDSNYYGVDSSYTVRAKQNLLDAVSSYLI